MQRSYAGSIGIFMRVPWLVLGGAVLAVGGGLLLLHFVPEQFFPSAERNQFVVDVWMPEGSRIEATDAAVRRMEKELKRDELVADYASFLGVSAPRFYYNVNPQPPDTNYAQMLVNTKAEKETPELVFKLRERLSGAAPEARVLVKELQQGNVVEAPVEVRITGPDAAELRTLGGKAAEILRQVPGAIYVHNDWHEASYQLRVSVREETANRLGLTNASIARQLAGGFEGAPVTTYWEGDRDVSVILRIEQERRETFEDVGDSYVTSTLTGARVPLRSVADFSRCGARAGSCAATACAR